MSRKTDRASAIALATMMGFVLISADTSGAAAQDPSVEAGQAPSEAMAQVADPSIQFISSEVVQPLPAAASESAPAASLEALVSDHGHGEPLSAEMACLAGAIYFESRGEPLIGQLAVANVVMNRAASGRFPGSYCGVVFQKGQFSFVRSGRMPAIAKGSRAWTEARAIARIAHERLWDNPARDALFFHATHVDPGWNRQRVTRVSSHIFYR